MSTKFKVLLVKMKRHPSVILPANMSRSTLKYLDDSLSRYKNCEMDNNERAVLESFVHEWTMFALDTYPSLNAQVREDQQYRNDLVFFLGMPELEFLVHRKLAIQIVGECAGNSPDGIFEVERIQNATYAFLCAYLHYEKFGLAAQCAFGSVRADMSEFWKRFSIGATKPDAIEISDAINELPN